MAGQKENLIQNTRSLVVKKKYSMSATGIGDGEFMIGGSRVVVKNGDARIPELDVRAGSILTMDKAFENICKFTGLGEDEVYPMFRKNQERLLGINLD